MNARARVLCVDDDPLVLECLNLQLAPRYEVVTALSGEQALQILASDPTVAVIISDLRMPQMDGATFLSRARQRAHQAGRILLSGSTDLPATVAAVNDAQVLKILGKPWKQHELLAAVEFALEQQPSGQDATGLRRVLTAQIASQDPITGMASRSRFMEELAECCVSSTRPGDTASWGLLWINLDNLSDINAVQGHTAGDRLMKEFAERLREHSPQARCIGRCGDEEFAVLLPMAFADETAVVARADALMTQLSKPIPSLPGAQRPRTSIGIAGIPQHTTDAESAVKFAGIAARQAKLQGGGLSCIFRSGWAHDVEYRYQLLIALREAIEGDGLTLNYQPIINADTGRVRSLEALARWQHPTIGNVPPTEFIALAEESGDMPRLGQWILRRACQDAAHLAGRFCERVAINVSVQQLLHDTFLRDVDNALQGAGLAAQQLELELTESVFSHDADRVLAAVTALRQRGIAVAIDDFGTGYSSLSYLQSLPVDTMKVDRSFVTTLGQGGETIIAAALSIGRSFGMQVVVEGVETLEQQQQLRALGISLFQGYLYARPMPLELVAPWFARSGSR